MGLAQTEMEILYWGTSELQPLPNSKPKMITTIKKIYNETHIGTC